MPETTTSEERPDRGGSPAFLYPAPYDAYDPAPVPQVRQDLQLAHVPAISIFGHMSPSDNDRVTSEHDGLRARKSGLWARDKLSFLDDFVPPALQATGCTPRPKRQRWYVDLFAGPGRNVHVKSGTEFEGSAIRVLPMSAQRNPAVHFTHAAIVNKDRDDQAALVERIRRLREKGLVPIPRAQYGDSHP